jgi:hypothetical protein
LFARSTTAARLARCGHLTTVLRAEVLCRRTSALVSQNSRRRRALLADEIVGQGERRAEILPVMRRPVLRKFGDGF